MRLKNMSDSDGTSTETPCMALLTANGPYSASTEEVDPRPSPIEHSIPKAFSLIGGGDTPKVCWQSFGHPTIILHLSDSQIMAFVEDGIAYIARRAREAARGD
jgi:hypothetical protein